MAEDYPVRTPIRRSLLRPLLMLGGERELVLAAGMVSVILIMAVATPVTIVMGLVFWGVSCTVFAQLAKQDPQMSKVYIRHVNKKIFYPARPHVSAADPEIKKHQ